MKIGGESHKHTKGIRFCCVDTSSLIDSGRVTDTKLDQPFMATSRAAAWPQGLQSLLDSILTWTRRKIGNSLILERL